MLRIILVFIFTVLISSSSFAFNYGEFVSCDEKNPEPRIIFKTSFGQLIHDLSTPQSQIQSKSSITTDKGSFIAGLATVRVKNYIRISSAKGEALDENHYCIMPEVIEVYIGYENPTIYVAKEYPQNSCHFSLIIRHEQTHQRINILTLEYFLPLIDKTLTKTINEVRSIKVSRKEDAQAALEILQQYYIAKITPIIDELSKARIAEHQKLDSIDNYSMENNLCLDFDNDRGISSTRIH